MSHSQRPDPGVPLVVIGGYLGAGKTTLVNHLLRQAGGRRVAVLVNDFGAVSIDADLIEGAADDVLALAGGCVCCSFGADLVGTLQLVLRRMPPPDIVLLECSGVGLPAAVARTAALVTGVVVEGVALVVDAAEIMRLQRDDYVGDTVRQQLREADLLILNQADRVDEDALAQVARALAMAVPGVPQVSCRMAQLPPALVLGLVPLGRDVARTSRDRSALSARRMRPPDGHALQRFRFEQRRVQGPVDARALAAELAAPGSGWLRAKGVVLGLDGQLWMIQVMGRRSRVEPAPPASRVETGCIVCIGAAAALESVQG